MRKQMVMSLHGLKQQKPVRHVMVCFRLCSFVRRDFSGVQAEAEGGLSATERGGRRGEAGLHYT